MLLRVFRPYLPFHQYLQQHHFFELYPFWHIFLEEFRMHQLILSAWRENRRGNGRSHYWLEYPFCLRNHGRLIRLGKECILGAENPLEAFSDSGPSLQDKIYL